MVNIGNETSDFFQAGTNRLSFFKIDTSTESLLVKMNTLGSDYES